MKFFVSRPTRSWPESEARVSASSAPSALNFSVAILAILALLAIPLPAQHRGGGGGFHGGGRGGGGFHGGGGGFHGGGSFHGGGGFHGSSGFRGRGFNRGGFRGYGRGFRYGSPLFGYGFGLGFGYPYYYDPFLFDSFYSPGFYDYNDYYPYNNYVSYPPVAASAPPVIINQDYAPQPVQPMAILPPQPVQPAQPPQPVQPPEPESSVYRPTIYLIAFRDGTIRAAVAYWVSGDSLHYVTRQHEIRTVSLDRIDRDFSIRLNRERRVDFRLPNLPQ